MHLFKNPSFFPNTFYRESFYFSTFVRKTKKKTKGDKKIKFIYLKYKKKK